jgi:hypothetical protein
MTSEKLIKVYESGLVSYSYVAIHTITDMFTLERHKYTTIIPTMPTYIIIIS